MSAEDKLVALAEQNRVRQARYYAINKAKVSEQRKARNTLPKEPKAPAVPIVIQPNPVKRGRRPVKAPTHDFINYEQALIKIDRSDSIKSDETRSTYKNHLKTVLGILQCDNLHECFSDATKTIQLIDSAKQKKDPSKGYSIASKKAFIQVILRLSDILDIQLSSTVKQQYIDAFDELKLDHSKQLDQQIEEGKAEPKTSYAEYIAEIKAKFGAGSKEYILARLYSVSGFRDDLQLRIVKIEEEAKDNLLILPVKGNVKIVLNQYKTAAKYGKKIIDIPADIGTEVREYVKQNELKFGEYLFGYGKLSGIISKMGKAIGKTNMSINGLRRLHVEPVIDSMDSKERVKLAKKMNHSVPTSAKYRTRKT